MIALVFFCPMSFLASAHGADSLDAEIKRLREGKQLTISDADFLKIRTNTFDKFLSFAAELYMEQIKWSLISPEKQGGWPYRSFVVESPEWVEEIHRKIKQKANETGDALFEYALICPALYLVDEEEVHRILTQLERRDKFLYRQASANLKTWRAEVSKRLRARR